MRSIHGEGSLSHGESAFKMSIKVMETTLTNHQLGNTARLLKCSARSSRMYLFTRRDIRVSSKSFLGNLIRLQSSRAVLSFSAETDTISKQNRRVFYTDCSNWRYAPNSLRVVSEVMELTLTIYEHSSHSKAADDESALVSVPIPCWSMRMGFG
jgi:hypothetical protein